MTLCDEDITMLDTFKRPYHQATSCRNLDCTFGSDSDDKPTLNMGISPSYGVQIRCSLMHWKPDDEALLLLLVHSLEDSLIILCDSDKV